MRARPAGARQKRPWTLSLSVITASHAATVEAASCSPDTPGLGRSGSPGSEERAVVAGTDVTRLPWQLSWGPAPRRVSLSPMPRGPTRVKPGLGHASSRPLDLVECEGDPNICLPGLGQHSSARPSSTLMVPENSVPPHGARPLCCPEVQCRAAWDGQAGSRAEWQARVLECCRLRTPLKIQTSGLSPAPPNRAYVRGGSA